MDSNSNLFPPHVILIPLEPVNAQLLVILRNYLKSIKPKNIIMSEVIMDSQMKEVSWSNYLRMDLLLLASMLIPNSNSIEVVSSLLIHKRN